MSLKLWRRLRLYAQRKEAEAFLERHHVNLKCPHCNTWTSAADDPSSTKPGHHPIVVDYQCGQCGKSSGWVCEAGFWFMAEDFLGADYATGAHP